MERKTGKNRFCLFEIFTICKFHTEVTFSLENSIKDDVHLIYNLHVDIFKECS